ncbi:hypothetical protein CDL12_27592 [Handroanthus impetiginosus]|uniref:VWFA domain-containing protein n=1 Tax=Handroanthus impetiginosus TaxID=429701 RepID=A0A2G9G3K9_9LAMI|nr:hypothetical protein CDL12_27592 [Handroanthus impetiginosus]
MAEDFEVAVKDGLRLSKRVYFGKDRAVAPPKPLLPMDRSTGHSYLPTSPMIYAVIGDPAIVDNPDMPSYQPHVHGMCDPPALIPLQLNRISLEVDCYMDTAFVIVSGSWRVHCVMGSRSCDCRIAVPMGEQGSILGVEAEVPRKSYSTQLIAMDSEGGPEKVANTENGAFLQPHIFTFTVPKIDGGTNISVKLGWSQKLMNQDGQFTLNIPFNFPDFVTPAGKKIPKHEKIELNLNSGPGTEIICGTTSHPLKEQLRKAGKLGFLYECDVVAWSTSDFSFTYKMSSSDTFGTVLLSPPSLLDVDDRKMFCCYLYPGKKQSEKVFRREVVFVVDISGSMKGKLLEDAKNALFAALGKLGPQDLFNVIAFNSETYTFSSSLEPATEATIQNSIQWISLNFVAGGGTNVLVPLNQAIEMFSDNGKSIPIIFLVTDGAVEDEKNICDILKSQLANRKNVSPRIYTLGIGIFCNHYFLRMLAILGRGHHDAAIDVDSIEVRMGRMFAKALSTSLANIAFENLDEVDDIEVFPCGIPDLSSESPLIVSGRYRGTFPQTLKVKGILPDMTNFSLHLKVQDAKEIPIDKMLAKQEIELLTAEAWYSDSEELKNKIEKMSVENAIVSEFTHMILLEAQRGKTTADSADVKKASSKVDNHNTEDSKPQKILMLHKTGLGFGNLSATAENIPPGSGGSKPPEAAEILVKATSNCCGRLCNHCCCVCCIQTFSRINDQFATLLTQLCGAAACLGCYTCCGSCCGEDG